MSWKKVKLREFLKQYRYEHTIQNDRLYKQVTISKHDGVKYRGEKLGKEIGRKRQFIVNLNEYENTLMFVRQGVDEGAIGIAPKEVDGCIATENMPMFSIEHIDVDFLRLLLKSPIFRSEIAKIPTTGSAQKSIHERQLLDIELCIPTDIKEQKQIVKQLQSTFSQIDSLSSEQTYQLNLIKKLRKQILKDAMQGKLVPQNLDDEPASELLMKIKAEKAKSNKKEKTLPEIKSEEIPFEIPKSWVWCRLGEICSKIGSGSTPKGSNYSKLGFPFFRSQNVYNNGLVYDDITFISEEVQKQMKGTIVLPNDILLNITGGSMGRCAIVPMDFKEGNVSQHVCIIRPIKIANKFLHNYILSPTFQTYIFSSTTGAGREGLPKYNLELFLIPLPSLPEQHRIVAKIDKLMALCDELEASVKINKEYTQLLYQTALKEALQPKENVKIYSDAEKAILAGHIISITSGKDFGRVKLQKLLHLTEYHCKIDVGSNYVRKAAGPHDENLINTVESMLQRYNFYNIRKEINHNHSIVKYTPLSEATQLDNLFRDNFTKEEKRIDGFLSKFKNSTWEQCEIVSTLYAVWNNRLIKKQEITDELIKKDFLAWSKEKAKYKTRLDNALDWMKEKEIIPNGWGKYIDIENVLSS